MKRGGALRGTLALVPLLLAAGGCAKADNEPGPGGVTVGEARALDRTAAMIEGQAPPDPLAAPRPQPSGPSAPPREPVSAR